MLSYDSCILGRLPFIFLRLAEGPAKTRGLFLQLRCLVVIVFSHSPKSCATCKSHHYGTCVWIALGNRSGRRVAGVRVQKAIFIGVGSQLQCPGFTRSIFTASAKMSNMDEETLFEEEMAVPKDQRPVNELKNLQESSMYKWVCRNGRFLASCPQIMIINQIRNISKNIFPGRATILNSFNQFLV